MAASIDRLRSKMQQENAIDLHGAMEEFEDALQTVVSDFQLLLRVATNVTSLSITTTKDPQANGHGTTRWSALVLSKVGEIQTIGSELKSVLTNANAVQRTSKSFHALEPTESMDDQQEQWAMEKEERTTQPSVWSGFYNKTLRERFDVLALMFPRLQRMKQLGDAVPDGTTAASTSAAPSSSSSALEMADPIAKLGELPMRTANLMIENCIGVLGIPLGLGLNFVIDGKSLSVPMAVEEPSVVAAASSAAKVVASCGGGFRTATTGNIMTSQIQLVDTPDIPSAIEAIRSHRERLLDLANTQFCPNMKKRGGGAVDIYCRIVTQQSKHQFTHLNDDAYWYTSCQNELSVHASDDEVTYLVVHIDVDVCEAMGANIVNTVAEGLSNEISQLTKSRCGLRILTNLCMQRRARSTFEIPVDKLGWKGVDGEQVAQRIIEAYNFAAVDPYRAVTNNKGIMNGIDAVAVATGQDWRAIEAAAHCYASRAGQYTSLSHYEIAVLADGTRVLRGSLELPIAVGSKGGALQTHPGYGATHTILQQPTARNLAAIIVSVGLAQNFAAIRAIAVTGIQKGHMALHARNIAVAAGAPSELVSELCSYMLGRKSVNIDTAKEYLQAHAVFSEIRNNSPPSSPLPVTLPSMFYVEIPVPRLEGHLSLNIAFESINKHPQYIAIMPQSKANVKQNTAIQHQLLGDKGYNQLEKMFMFLASMRAVVTTDAADQTFTRANLPLQNKLQLLSILINIVAYRLMELRSTVVHQFMKKILELRELDVKKCRKLLADVPASDEVLCTGLPLFLALWQVLHYHIEQEVPHTLLRERIVQEQWILLDSILQSFELQSESGTTLAFEDYMRIQSKRWQASMFLLIDSLALNREVVTLARVAFLGRIGEFLEWEGTIAHDMARYERAIAERIPNSFVYWMKLQKIALEHGNVHLHAFCQMAEQLARHKWQLVVEEAQATPSAAQLFSLAAVERVVQLIQDIYRDRSGQRPRKESF